MPNKKEDLPKWAKRLLEENPGAELPTEDNPIPAWLEDVTKKKALWYIIRGGEPHEKHPYLLIKELYKEPEQWEDILNTLPDQVNELAKTISEWGIEEVIFTGCGSAYFTALHGQLVFPAISGIRSRAIESFELEQYFPDVDPKKTLVIAHSGTGGSIETRNAMKRAKDAGCHTLALVNTEESPLSDICERSFVYVTGQGCGPCINVISTRILMQTMLGIAIGKLAKYNIDLLERLEGQLSMVPKIGQAFLEDQESAVRDLAEKHKETQSFFLVGSGPHYFSAREGALKIEEESICVNKAHRPGDFHHGIISVLDPKHCTITIAAERDAVNERVVDCLKVSKAADTPTISVVFGEDKRGEEFADDTIKFDGGLDELLTTIPLTLFFQLFGYYRGVARGYNPDTLRTDYWPNAKAWLTAFPLGDH